MHRPTAAPFLFFCAVGCCVTMMACKRAPLDSSIGSSIDSSIETGCALIATRLLAEGDWRLGDRDTAFRAELEQIKRTYVETGRDMPAVDIVRKYAPALLAECSDWLKQRGYSAACKTALLGTEAGGECWSRFFGSGGGNDLDWMLKVARFDEGDVSRVVAGSWARASREIDVCGASGCTPTVEVPR